MNVSSKLVLSLAGMMALGLSTLASAEWYDTVNWYGDLRFRHESLQTENNGATEYSFRDRQRVRARVGLKATLDDYWLADIRLATDEPSGANGDPVSSNQTLGDNESRKPIWLDLAYIQYKVLFNNGKLMAGKMKNPFETVGGSQLIWDADLTPEGIGGQFNLDVMPDLNVFLNGAGVWIKEVSASYDPMVYGAQVGAKTKFLDTKLTAGFGYFEYIDSTNQAAFGTAAGNSLLNGKYANNFMLGEGFVDYNFALFEFPVKIYGDYVLNNGANRFNRGYLAGLIFNKAKNEGSWEVGYNFRQVQKDAVVGAFSDSDFIGGGTNGDGHQVTAAYMVTDGVKLNLTMFRNRKNLDAAVNPFYNRFQADVILSF